MTLREILKYKILKKYDFNYTKLTDASPEILDKLATSSDDIELIKSITRNPNVLQQTLDQLSKSADTRIRCLIAGHSKTLNSTLLNLCFDGSLDVKATLCRRIRPSDRDLLSQLAESKEESIKRLIVEHKAVSRDILEKIARSSTVQTRLNILRREDLLDVDIIKVIYQAENSSAETDGQVDERIRQAIAKCPITPLYMLKKFVIDSSKEVKLNLLKNPNINTAMIEALANDVNDVIRSNIARMDTTPRKVLLKLIEDENKDVWMPAFFRLEGNMSNDVVVGCLSNFSQDKLSVLAKYGKTNARLQRILLEVGKETVKVALASNNNLDYQVAEILKDNSFISVLKALIKNPRLHPNHLQVIRNRRPELAPKQTIKTNQHSRNKIVSEEKEVNAHKKNNRRSSELSSADNYLLNSFAASMDERGKMNDKTQKLADTIASSGRASVFYKNNEKSNNLNTKPYGLRIRNITMAEFPKQFWDWYGVKKILSHLISDHQQPNEYSKNIFAEVENDLIIIFDYDLDEAKKYLAHQKKPYVIVQS